MSLLDVFSAITHFPFDAFWGKKKREEQDRVNAKASVEASEEGKKINELKDALDEVKALREMGSEKNL